MTPLISGLASLASLLFNASQSGSGNATAPRRNGEAANAGPAALVSWSPEARGLAGQGALGAESASALTHRVGRPAESASGTAEQGRVSRQDFQDLLARFGATEQQTLRLTSRFDADQDGSISHEEFQKGLARAAGDRANDPLSQVLLGLMDAQGNCDGRVNPKELAALTGAFARAEHPARSA